VPELGEERDVQKDENPPPSQPAAGITRRDAVTGTVAAAIGLGSSAKVKSVEGAKLTPQHPTRPRTPGYFISSGGMHIPRGQGFDATNATFYEAPVEDPDYLEIFCYTDKISYAPGETVTFHTSTTAAEFSLEIVRDGLEPRLVHSVASLRGALHKLPIDFFEKGCDWPVSYQWTLPDDLSTGFYIVTCRASRPRADSAFVTLGTGKDLIVREQHHGFFVRRHSKRAKADILLVAATSTWTAYNDWGGYSHYVGHDLPNQFTHAPRLSLHRPFARGFIWSPEGAPRKPHQLKPGPKSIPLYPPIEFAYTHGYSKFFANAGWATYERPFVVFAEAHGYNLDYATQIDLHYDRSLLNDYKCVVFVGHCEYWTWEMREAVDGYVEAGGNAARFAGNLAWQIRLEDEGRTQVAYKARALDSDPVRNTDQKSRLTGFWDAPEVAWPGAATFGLNASYGVYAHVGVQNPRGTGGFTVYRPEHWAFAGTDLYYGDDFGSEAKIFGYEVDGLDFTFRDGLPYPTYRDGARPGTEILAMALASNREAEHGNRGSVFYYGDDSAGLAAYRYGATNEETSANAARASGMIVCVQHGKGTVFHAGTCEWVAGLKARDFYTETVTRNVLNRFTGKS
jgi:hypothetical protein